MFLQLLILTGATALNYCQGTPGIYYPDQNINSLTYSPMSLIPTCPRCKKDITNGTSYIPCGCSEREILDAITKPFFTEEEIKKLQEDDGTKRAMNINLFEFNRKINSNNQ